MTNNHQRMLEYWKQAHCDQDMSKLTGTSLQGHLDFLRVVLPPEQQLLCIGIGDGGWVREIVEHAFWNLNGVWTLDIVQNILIGVVPATDPKTLPSNFFGLALSLWVAPHMDDEELAEQLQHIVRSLSKDGVLAIHYNEPIDDKQQVLPVCVETMLAGTMLRTREKFIYMVRDAGGTLEIVNVLPCPQYDMQMVAAHIRKGTQ